MSRHLNDDSSELAKGLEDSLEQVISKYWPSWIKSRVKGQDVALLTPRIKGKNKRPTSSFTVNLNGGRRGQWYRFSQAIGGGALALLHYGHHGNVPSSKSDWAEAYKLAREFLGVTQQREESVDDRIDREKRRERNRQDREERERRDAANRARKQAERTMSALEVWNGSIPLAGSHGEAYLIARGVPPVSQWPWSPHKVLRFHPELDFERDRTDGVPVRFFPAIVAKVENSLGGLQAVHQIYLNRATPTKADHLYPACKMGRGPEVGGAIRIGGDAGRIGVAEGIETAIGLWVLEGYRMPVWSLLSTSGMRNFEPPMTVQRISIYHDSDKGLLENGRVMEPPGISAARALRDNMSRIGVSTNFNEMPILGDGLDLLQTKNEIENERKKD